MTRRSFIKNAFMGSSLAFLPGSLFSMAELDVGFPLIDYHVHLTFSFPIDKAVQLSKTIGVKFGIVEHPGLQYALKNDNDLQLYIDKLRKHPVYVGVQPMRRGWSNGFSNKVLDKLDYILMDADTIPLENDEVLSIWRHNNYIENIDAFMEMYMDHIVHILTNEPLNIFARPTYLPVNFGRYYDKVWTNEKMRKIIELAKKRDIALEISTPMHVPSKKFILQAKEEGLKFTLGTNARNEDAGKFHYGIQMIKECRLTQDDFLVI